jgi:hypothetical protein
MPTVTQQVVDAFAFCRDGRCPGYAQQPVKAIRTTTSFSFVDNGGDWPGEERSVDHLAFIRQEGDPDYPPCPHCGQPMAVAEQERPEYANASGQDPMRIYNLDQSGRVRDLQLAGMQSQVDVADLRAQMAEQAARQAEQIAELKAELASRPRGPGRPRKVEEE